MDGHINGVARRFWGEIFDLRTPLPDERDKRPTRLRRVRIRRLDPYRGRPRAA
jgi:hypothetical protein